MAKSLDRRYTSTDILNDADRHIDIRSLSALTAWQACSAITHGNRNSVLMLLERETLAIEGTVTTYNVTASAMITAEILHTAVACVRKATDLFIAQAKA